MGNKNDLLKRMEARISARYAADYERKLSIANQIGLDAAIIAANDVLHLGKGRAVDFGAAYIETVNKIAEMMDSDGKDDANLEYSKADIDRRLLKIVGADSFAPWEVRYS